MSLGSRPDAPKLKVDASFMMLINTDADWEQKVLQAGDKLLVIVDVFSPTWGPCEMLASHFSNMFFDLGEDLGMRFVRADSSKLAACAEFKDNPKPHFLFIHNGTEVERIEGPNLPAIDKTVKTKAPRLREVPGWSG